MLGPITELVASEDLVLSNPEVKKSDSIPKQGPVKEEAELQAA
jgi:hypothetical protein